MQNVIKAPATVTEEFNDAVKQVGQYGTVTAIVKRGRVDEWEIKTNRRREPAAA